MEVKVKTLHCSTREGDLFLSVSIFFQNSIWHYFVKWYKIPKGFVIPKERGGSYLGLISGLCSSIVLARKERRTKHTGDVMVRTEQKNQRRG